jgi:hypothetical protein
MRLSREEMRNEEKVVDGEEASGLWRYPDG